MNLRSLVGLVLSLAGAVLDFLSGYLILGNQSMTTTNDMGMAVTQHNAGALPWGLALLVLGALLVATGVLGASSLGLRRMTMFGGAMAIYGMIMLGVGYLMYSGMAPLMQGSMASSLAMFLIGAAMIANGALMAQRPRTRMMQAENKHTETRRMDGM